MAAQTSRQRIWLLSAAIFFLAAPHLAAGGFTMYAVSGSGPELVVIDLGSSTPSTPVVMTLAGATIQKATGIARHPVTGALYVTVVVAGETPARLGIVNPATGVITNIGPADDGSSGLLIDDITFTSDGTLYGVSADQSAVLPESLFTIDPATGRATLVTHLGNGGQGEGLSFDPATGLLYHASGNDIFDGGSSIFESINPASPGDPPIPIDITGVLGTLGPAIALAHWTRDYFVWVTDALWPEINLVRSSGWITDEWVAHLPLPFPAPAGIAFAGSPPACPQTLYGSRAGNGEFSDAALFAIDPATGSAQIVGPIGFGWIVSMDFGSDGVLYAKGSRLGDFTPVLLSIDPCTGQGTEIAPINAGSDISVRADGTLYSYQSGSLSIINTANGAETLVGNPGNFGNGNALAFNLAGDVLFHASSSQLFSIDPATGASTLWTILNFPTPGDVNPRLNAMDADPVSGTIHAAHQSDAGTFLSTVSTSSGQVTIIGPTVAGLEALAFRSGTTPSQFILSVQLGGTGSGAVISSPGGIDCGATCSSAFDVGTVLTLTATPATGHTFTGWSAACSGTGPCDVTMSGPRIVTARFDVPQTLTVTLAGAGTGTVTSNPPGIDCGSTCSAEFTLGSSVILAAQPALGSKLAGWSGDCITTNGNLCFVQMDAAKNVTATFDVVPTFTLTVTFGSSGLGHVRSLPAGIDCGPAGPACSASFNEGTVVTLLANYDDTSTSFAGWNGPGWNAPCVPSHLDPIDPDRCDVTMDGDHTVTATFTAFHNLSISLAGTGAGSVSGSASCSVPSGNTCIVSPVEGGTVITLTAIPSTGSTFAGWGGDCSGTAPSCSFNMHSDKSVTATFDLLPQFGLTVSASGAGTGTVTSNPTGVDCGATCSASFPSGTVVTLTATAASNSIFAGWGGACGGTGTCTVAMDAAKAVTATFDLAPPSVMLARSSLVFAAQLVGTPSAVQTITLTNNGGSALTISGMALDGANAGDFTRSDNCGGSVNAGASCTITVTFRPGAAGARAATLTITDNAAGSPHQVNLSGSGMDFAVQPASGIPSQVTIAAGQAATFQLSLTAAGGFSGVATVACSGTIPAGMCSVSSTSVTFSETAPGAVTVSVTTTSNGAFALNSRRQAPPLNPIPVYRWAAVLLLVAVTVAGWRRNTASRLRWAHLLPLSMLVFAVLLLTACGGGTVVPPTGTPPGTYSFAVSVQVGSASRTTTLNVIVK